MRTAKTRQLFNGIVLRVSSPATLLDMSIVCGVSGFHWLAVPLAIPEDLLSATPGQMPSREPPEPDASMYTFQNLDNISEILFPRD